MIHLEDIQIIGLRVVHKDGMGGFIAFLPPRQPWQVRVVFDDDVIATHPLDLFTLEDRTPLTFYLTAGLMDNSDVYWESLVLLSRKSHDFSGYVQPDFILPNDIQSATRYLIKMLEALPTDVRLASLTTLKDISPLSKLVAETVRAARLEGVPKNIQDAFWAKHKPNQIRDPLYSCAPPEVQFDIWLNNHLAPLSIKERATELSNTKWRLTPQQWTEQVAIVAKELVNDPTLDEQFQRFRLEHRLRFFTTLDDLHPFRHQITKSLVGIEKQSVPDNVIHDFWERHLPESPRDWLYELAPRSVRAKTWVRLAGQLPLTADINSLLKAASADLRLVFFTALDDLSPYLPVVIVTLDPLKQLDDSGTSFHDRDILIVETFGGNDVLSLASDIYWARAQITIVLEAFWKKHTPTSPLAPLFAIAPMEVQRRVWANLAHTPALAPEIVAILPTTQPDLIFEFLVERDTLGEYLDLAIQLLATRRHPVRSPGLIEKFWQKHAPSSPVSNLYAVAPESVQRAIWLDQAKHQTLDPQVVDRVRYISPALRLEFLAERNVLGEQLDLAVELLEATDSNLLPADLLEKFWARHAPTSPHSPLYVLAPENVRRAVWTQLAKLSTLPTATQAVLYAQSAGLILAFLAKRESLEGYLDLAVRLLRSKHKVPLPMHLIDEFWARHAPSSPLSPLYSVAPERVQRVVWIQMAKQDTLEPEVLVMLSSLPSSLGLAFFAEVKSIDNYLPLVIALLQTNQQGQLDAKALNGFWDRHQPNTPRHALYPFLSPDRKFSVCQKFFSHLLDQLDNMFRSDETTPFKRSPRIVYRELTPGDRALGKSWAHSSLDAVMAQMLSARGAEKFAASFYAQLGFKVQDVAIHQIDEISKDWLTHDIALSGGRSVDVKNSRVPPNGQSSYVEHTVPRFKHDRHHSDVCITAVLSPFLSLDKINHPEFIDDDVDDLVVLGETTRTKIDRLCETFNSPRLQVRALADRTIPPWFFDYPEEWYAPLRARQDQLLSLTEWPTADELDTLFPNRSHGVAQIPKLLAARIPLPGCFEHLLLPWQREFCQLVIDRSSRRTSLSHIFFSLLADFLWKLESPPLDFTPTGYLELLYTDSSSLDPGTRCPLGLVDPLGVIHRLLEILDTIWDQRDTFSLGRLRQFRFSGLGLLQGRTAPTTSWITIVAYCGGWLQKSAPSSTLSWADSGASAKLTKCGFTPLVIGKHGTCSHCGKLICPECQFCSQPCEDAGVRQARTMITIDTIDQDGNIFVTTLPALPAHLAEELPLDYYEEWADQTRGMKP
jgi:hypothetical protein